MTNSRPFIPLSVPHLTGDEAAAVARCFETNWVSSAGPDIDCFGERFADFVGAKRGVPLASGTAALHLALEVLGVGPGDRVYVPTLTFIASVNPIRYVGAEPVFLDSERQTYNLDPQKTLEKLERDAKAGKAPKAIILVHLYGHPAMAGKVISRCRELGVFVIEDATESLGARVGSQAVGTLGDIGFFSFNGNKLITTGSGGMLVTNRPEWADRATYLATQAKDDPIQFHHEAIGFNYRLSNIQAAMGLAQLGHIEEFLAAKRDISRRYDDAFQAVSGLTTAPEQPGYTSSNWLYRLLVEKSGPMAGAHELMERLRRENIQARPFWKPIHLMPMFKGADSTDLTQSLWLWERGLNLPCSVGLTPEEQGRVIETVLGGSHR